MSNWSPESWKEKTLHQIPVYPDPTALAQVVELLSSYPPLVFAGEARQLKMKLAEASEGKAFVLQGGDCAESFSDFRAVTIRDSFRVLLQMAIILTFGEKRPVIKMGRVGGQFAKPRSEEMETREGVSLPCYRGDMINSIEFTEASRRADPERMLRAYAQSAATLNLLRAFSFGGYADLNHVNKWNLNFVKESAQSEKYRDISERLSDALEFMKTIGITGENTRQIREVDFYTSHEALLLPFEQALTRRDSTSALPDQGYLGDWYDCSAHFLWLGDRTRQLEGAHVEFLRGINNPIGIKCGPSITTDTLLRLIDVLNPQNEPGRITLISRMGAGKITDALIPLVRKVKSEGKKVVWICDPMHGNTLTTRHGFKTRLFEDILSEVKRFYEIHKSENSFASGVHFEMTGKNVIECLGGDQKITEEQLSEDHYDTLCDPRLNASQALELAFQLCHFSRS